MKNKKLLVLVPFLLLMASCGDKNSNSNSISDSNSTSNSTTQPVGAWSDDIKALMREVIGEELPYVELDSKTVEYGKDSDSDGDYFYVLDSSNVSIVESYKSTLTANGYTLSATTSDDYGSDVFLYVKDTIVVQLYYFIGAEEDNEVYDPGNRIAAWLDIPTQRTDLTEWPDDLKQLMTSTFNMQIPFVALASDFEYSLSGEVLYIYDESDTDFLSDGFGESLLSAGFTKSNINSDYETYTLVLNESAYISVEFAYSEPYEFLGFTMPGSNEVYVTLNHVTNTWPTEVVRSVYDKSATVVVPEFAVTGNYEYYLANGGMVISGDVDADITDDYVTKLNANNFMTDEDFFGNQFYADWEENVNVAVEYSSPKFMVQVVAAEKSYDELVTSFPTDKIKDLLGEDATEVPSIDIKIGDNIKYTFVDADEEFGTSAYIELTYKDDTSDISKSIMTSYLEVLKAAGWTIDDTYYDEYGVYDAVSANEDVALEFYSDNNKFVLDIQLNESSSTTDGEWDSDLKAMMIELLGEEIPYVALDSETIEYSKESFTDGSGEYIYICDYSDTSVVDEYKSILLANGYKFEEEYTDEYETLVSVYTKGNIIIEISYYAGEDGYSGNDIYAYTF